MKICSSISVMVLLMLCSQLIIPVLAQELKNIALPVPKLDPSKSLVQALKARKTSRQYTSDNLSMQILANLLWAATGITRPDSGSRTAPTAKNWQEVDVYVVTTRGIYRYVPETHTLMHIVTGDWRFQTYTLSLFKNAPVNLVYVSDLERMGTADEPTKMILTAMDTGFVAQNVYLYCASEGLDTALRISIDRDTLSRTLKLKPTQKIMAAQSVGAQRRRGSELSAQSHH